MRARSSLLSNAIVCCFGRGSEAAKANAEGSLGDESSCGPSEIERLLAEAMAKAEAEAALEDAKRSLPGSDELALADGDGQADQWEDAAACALTENPAVAKGRCP